MSAETVFPERPGRVLPAGDGPLGEGSVLSAETGRLHLQRCADCGTWRHPPRFRCAACGSDAVAWEPVSGRGRVFTWTVTHRPVDPAFAAEVPYAVVVVELEEGPRVVGNLLGIATEELSLDLPVEVVVEAAGPRAACLHFRRPA